MSFSHVSLSVFGVAAVMAATAAAAMIWLLVTDPLTVADAVNTGQVTPLVRALADVLLSALRSLLDYL